MQKSLLCFALISAGVLGTSACGLPHPEYIQDASLDEFEFESSTLDDASGMERIEVARALTEQHYLLIQDWLRRHALLGQTHQEVIALSATLDAAEHYLRCHEDTKSPTGWVSRIELLSVCLRQGNVVEQPEQVALTTASSANR